LYLLFVQVTGKCGSIWVRLIPAPRGTGIVSAPVPKKLLQMAGIEDCYTSAKGSTGTLGNFGESSFFMTYLNLLEMECGLLTACIYFT
jgi:ribosomal protein S5